MALFLVWGVLFHATFYERVTPFGLCNAPMTFERLMRIFWGNYCRFRLASLKFHAQNYKSFPFKVKFMTTRDLIRSSQDWTCAVLVETRNAKQIHSYIKVAKTAVGNIVCSSPYKVHRFTEKWRVSSGPSVTKPFIANLPVLQSLPVQHFMDLTLNTGVNDLELGAVLPKKQMERHKSSCLSVASNCNSRLHFRKTNIARSTIF